MGNHCIDVSCATCGTSYCLRDCGKPSKPDAKLAKKYQKTLKENPELHMFLSADKCCVCKAKTIYPWGTLNK